MIIRIVNDYLFTEIFPNQIKPIIIYPRNYPPNILVQTFFNYFLTFIFSIFLNFYQKSLIENRQNKDESSIKSDTLFKYELIPLVDINKS